MLGQDLRYALRLLIGNPGFALVALVTMALGIGANTAIFSVIDTVLLRQAPVKDIDALAVVWETDRNTSTTREPASLPDFLDFKQRSQRVEQIAAFAGNEVNYTPDQGEAIRLQALAVTDELLPMLGVRPVAGRGFTADEARAGGPAVVVISDGFWTRAFGRDTSVVGRTVRLDDRPFTVIGIMERGADFGVFQILSAADYSRAFADRGARAAVDVWLPLQQTPTDDAALDAPDLHGGAASGGALPRHRRSSRRSPQIWSAHIPKTWRAASSSNRCRLSSSGRSVRRCSCC